MYEKELMELERISKAVGERADYVQGGGGNTSVKLDGEKMAVKASGFKLKQITPREGYVVVNYRNIVDYYNEVDLSSDKDFEKESVEFVKQNIIETDGLAKLRPSVEAGFHSILKKYVIHTHPVYANILCCSRNGRELTEKVFAGSAYATIWIPYINPGFCLSLKIKEEIARCREKTGKFPEVIFMENHGLIISADDSTRCIELHKEVNDRIIAFMHIGSEYPQISIVPAKEDTLASETVFLKEFLKANKVGYDYFENILCPDQLVYLSGNICLDGMEGKLNINTDTGSITYKTNHAEALTLEETLLAFIYVMSEVKKNKLELKVMSPTEVDFIRNWESEAYRRSLVKNLKG
jgi:rhamnose utilization protein RhaD (predicted bifunctional aldolase and dehydrogenase)